MSYSTRYRTPSPLFPTPSPTSLERLMATWEELRRLDTEGYRTSSARPMSTWLVRVNWADGRVSPRSTGRGTVCSPFVTQSVAMAYSKGSPDGEATPVLAGGEALPLLFCIAANGNLKPAYHKMMDRLGMTQADNEWPRPVIFFNMGYAVELTELRRGDCVHIDWENGGGHAVFVWDVHLDKDGLVDAFQYISANGRIKVGDSRDGAGLGVSVGGTPAGDRGFIRQIAAAPPRYEVLKSPLFVDDERYVAEGVWVTWKSRAELKLRDLKGCRVTPRGRLAYAKIVKAARFHGVVPPPPFAMGPPSSPATSSQATDGPEPGGRPAGGGRASVRQLQERLKLLYELGWISSDTGPIDGKAGKKTVAAVRAFQSSYRLTVDGIAGRKTLAKLAEVYSAACLSPEGKQFLATGSGARAPGAAAALSFAAGDENQVEALYFRHGAGRGGEAIPLVLRVRNQDGESLAVELLDVQSGQRHPVAERLVPDNDRAVQRVVLPEVQAPTALCAILPDLDARSAPIYVFPREKSRS
jgi:hypothetical protein